MNFTDIVAQMKPFEDSEDYKNFVNGLLTAERVNAFLDTAEGKKVIEPRLDKHFTKSLKTWQDNNLDKLVNDRYKQLHPDADPKDAKVAELEATIKAMQLESARKDLTNKALGIASEKGLPSKLVSFFIGEDEKATTNNMVAFTEEFIAAVEAEVTKRLGSNHKPPEGDKPKTYTPEQLNAMSFEEINKYYNSLK